MFSRMCVCVWGSVLRVFPKCFHRQTADGRTGSSEKAGKATAAFPQRRGAAAAAVHNCLLTELMCCIYYKHSSFWAVPDLGGELVWPLPRCGVFHRDELTRCYLTPSWVLEEGSLKEWEHGFCLHTKVFVMHTHVVLKRGWHTHAHDFDWGFCWRNALKICCNRWCGTEFYRCNLEYWDSSKSNDQEFSKWQSICSSVAVVYGFPYILSIPSGQNGSNIFISVQILGITCNQAKVELLLGTKYLSCMKTVHTAVTPLSYVIHSWNLHLFWLTWWKLDFFFKLLNLLQRNKVC